MSRSAAAWVLVVCALCAPLAASDTQAAAAQPAPASAARVLVGRYLFYDTRLSGNGTQSCGTCHRQARALLHDARFADPWPAAKGR